MPPVLFLQSEVENPYALYEIMLIKDPVYWDETSQLWALYCFSACEAVLTNPDAFIPAINQNNKDGLNAHALRITNHLSRLSNSTEHAVAREIAMLLFQKMKSIAIGEIVEKILQNQNLRDQIDFVNIICKSVPVRIILESFDFTNEDSSFISNNIEAFVKIMATGRTAEQIKHINEIAEKMYNITEKYILAAGMHQSIINSLQQKYTITEEEVITTCVSNLIGIFIQGYDAGRGILSNSLLHIVGKSNFANTDLANKYFIEKSVIETLRFDPPVQNTRRVAAEDIFVNGIEIKKEQSILIVLAAANRDPKKFNHPSKYDIERLNNNEHLTFGAGHHQCLAKYFSIKIATDTLTYLFQQYKDLKFLKNPIEYEPAINVRLPKKIMIDVC